MEQQAEVLATHLKSSGTTTSSSSISLDDAWKRVIQGKDSETVETAKADLGSVLLLLLKSNIQDPAIVSLNSHIQWARRQLQELVATGDCPAPNEDMDGVGEDVDGSHAALGSGGQGTGGYGDDMEI